MFIKRILALAFLVTFSYASSCDDVKKEIDKTNELYAKNDSGFFLGDYHCKEDKNKNVISLRIVNSVGPEEIPDFVFGLTTLREFELSDASILRIPNKFRKLRHLKKLNLKDNEIKSFPSDISSLKSLEELDLSRNSITTIPREIGSLKKLKKLNLSSNEISSIPKELEQLKLKKLDLSENPVMSGKKTTIKKCYK